MLPVWFTWTKDQVNDQIIYATKEGNIPSWWINFIIQTPTILLFEDINRTLAQWNAKILRNGKEVMLIFRSSSDLTIFLLRWQK